MTTSPDAPARIRALTDLDSTLLVEAAAGTGKTSLLAGRMTMLLANGWEPASLAAITFMEAAAGELSGRVYRFVHELLDGTVPVSLRLALPDGLSVAQRTSLVAARTRLDALTTSTIHGFCQTLIRRYAVEASVDPGARMIDAAEAEVLFDAVFDRWLRRRLTVSLTSADPIAVLSKEDPKHLVSIVREMARLRLQHLSAHTVPEDLSGRPDNDLVEAVDAFRRWAQGAPQERVTLAALADLEDLARYYAGSFESPADFPALWRLAHPRRVAIMRRDSFQLTPLRCKSAWQRLAGQGEGARLSDEATALYARADACFRAIHGRIATALAARLSKEIDEVLADYAGFKRSAALLDFDDLLYRARDLILGHDEVRKAVGYRYPRILVDEFQDTDPIQAEILFRIASVSAPSRWDESELRDGSLFMVGDPKQAIYRFRGADIETYSRAKQVIARAAPQNILHVNANFRSQPGILSHVNTCFKAPLSADEQPGYAPLLPTRERLAEDFPCVARRTIRLPDEATGAEPRADDVRDAEASDIAHVCVMLLGNIDVRLDDGTTRKLIPADIALLTPTANELWRYEQALERRGLSFASQAGKNLYGKQETQDLLSLARVLADPFDTLAFGALLRGPLVGLTENELLDITAHLQTLEPLLNPSDLGRRFTVTTDSALVQHPVARETLLILRELRRRATSTTPSLLLGEAVERFAVRPLLALREGDRANQALANVDTFLELARGYNVRGLKQFVTDAARDWRAQTQRREGRVDATEEAIEIVTMHSAKGREWPVVILINTFTRFRPREQFVHRPSDDTVHWVIKDVVPPDLELALQSDAKSVAREHERLFYVAFTRAKDLLVLPKVPSAGGYSWTAIISDPHLNIPELNLATLSERGFRSRPEEPNKQSSEVFAAQQAALSANLRSIHWIRPSQDDLDRSQSIDQFAAIADDGLGEDSIVVGAGRVRGLVLHKLMEEVLNREIADDLSALVGRAGELLFELTTSATKSAALPTPEELGLTVLRTLSLPEIAEIRHGLVPELTVFGSLAGSDAKLVAGRADAVFVEEQQARMALDWKSDVAPSVSDIESHAGQLLAYMRATKIARGALVYMSTSRLHWVDL